MYNYRLIGERGCRSVVVAMAGQYFSDPRPYYFISGDQKLSFLDDVSGNCVCT